MKLIFDSGLGAYVVLDIPDTYYLDGVYFRIDDGGWVVGSTLDGPWHVEEQSTVPPGLRKKYSVVHEKKDHPGKGHGAAKGDW